MYLTTVTQKPSNSESIVILVYHLKSSTFWDITLCSPLKASSLPRGEHNLGLEVLMALYPENSTLYNHCCENLKSYRVVIYLYLLAGCPLKMNRKSERL
jgi:hypothetical protein